MLSVKRSSLWLTALPIQEQGFHLNKQEFQDALRLKYGWDSKLLCVVLRLVPIIL